MQENKKVSEKIEIKTKKHKNWPRFQNKKMTWSTVSSYTSWYKVGDEQSWAMAGRGFAHAIVILER